MTSSASVQYCLILENKWPEMNFVSQIFFTAHRNVKNKWDFELKGPDDVIC